MTVTRKLLFIHSISFPFIQAEIFCGALFMQQLVGLNIYLCVVTILAVVAIYTVIGKFHCYTSA